VLLTEEELVAAAEVMEALNPTQGDDETNLDDFLQENGQRGPPVHQEL